MDNKLTEKTATDIQPYRKPVGKKYRKAQRRKTALINAELKLKKDLINEGLINEV